MEKLQSSNNEFDIEEDPHNSKPQFERFISKEAKKKDKKIRKEK